MLGAQISETLCTKKPIHISTVNIFTEFEAHSKGKLSCGSVAIFLPLKTQLIQSETMEIFLTH